MTEGTSQGLFIVTAIVIFGIFVVMAYILFEDTLSPALASMFTQATEQATHTIGYRIDIPTMYIRNITGTQVVHEQTKDSVIYSSEGGSSFGDGVFFSSSVLDVNKNYKLSFDFTVLEGEVGRLGGHLTVARKESTVFKINGVEAGGYFYEGVPYNFENGETYKVDVYFTTDNVERNEKGQLQIIGNFHDGENNTRIFIQPDRLGSGGVGGSNYKPHKVKIGNIRFETR